MAPLIEITIRRSRESTFTAELRAFQRTSIILLAPAQPVTISVEALRSLSTLPDAYGAALSAMVFPPALREAWQRARGASEVAGTDIQLRVLLDDPTGELHGLRWELLRDPVSNISLAQQESASLARLVPSDSLYDPDLPVRPVLRALIAVAGPSDSPRWGLASVDVIAEAERALAALGDIPVGLLASDHPHSRGRATLANLRHGLREGPHILYLICHGRTTAAGSILYLENENGSAAPILGDALAAEVAALDPAQRPLLAVLVACEGGSQEAAPHAAAGPLLARVGIPAVVAMQMLISMPAAAKFTARLFRELGRDGQINRALAAARKEMGEEWWVPALWLRSLDGRLWQQEAAPDPHLATRERTLRALLHDHSGFIASRMEAFVGREQELDEIRERIDEKLPTGGYIIITGQAGQGKSSVIAKLVADGLQLPGSNRGALREKLQQPGVGVPICHFIPLSPGPDHQVGLLRNLLARLCLTYGLPDFYATSDSRPTLRDYFAAALRDLAQQGHQEIIYIDGLDQIEEDASGVRDLSFLPDEPPVGIVFVISTRPNDTLEPLELRKPQHEYLLPALSRADFERILQHRKVVLAATMVDRFYTAMQENALYLDLVARELAQTDASEPEQIIARIADNPANLFSLAIERLHRNERQWEYVLRPILGLLLVARAPFSQRALRVLTGADTFRTRQGLQRLGGLVQPDGEGRYGLFHLKLGDFLRQEVFDAADEEGYHQQLVGWCESSRGGIEVIWNDVSGAGLEPERRAYARQHYIAHLAGARSYDRLWATLDDGMYGQAKLRRDPSGRAYALDLDMARQAASAEKSQQEGAFLVPQLWRYTLLRVSLSSRIDSWPDELFLVLAQLDRANEMAARVELLSDPERQIRLYVQLALLNQPKLAMWEDTLIARAMAALPAYLKKVTALSVKTLESLAVLVGRRGTLADVTALTDSFPAHSRRANALGNIGCALAPYRPELAREVLMAAAATARQVEGAITDRIAALGAAAEASAPLLPELSGELLEEAVQLGEAEGKISVREGSLLGLALLMTEAGQYERAVALVLRVSGAILRDRRLNDIVERAAGDSAVSIDWACTVAQHIESGPLRANALTELARAVAPQNWETAESLLHEAEGALEGALKDDPKLQTWWRTAHVRVLVAGRRLDHAQVVAAEEIRDEARAELASGLARAGFFERAEQLALAIRTNPSRIITLMSIATAAIEHGAFEQAESITGKAPMAQVHTARMHLAVTFAKHGQFERAAAATRTLLPHFRAQTLAKIAQLAIDHPALAREIAQEAWQIATTHEDNSKPQGARRELQMALLRSEQFELAEQVLPGTDLTSFRHAAASRHALRQRDPNQALSEAQKIRESKRQSEIYAELAMWLAEAGDVQGALYVARRTPNLEERTQALSAVAQQMAVSQPAEAVVLFREARQRILEHRVREELARAAGILLRALAAWNHDEAAQFLAECERLAWSLPIAQWTDGYKIEMSTYLALLAQGAAGINHEAAVQLARKVEHQARELKAPALQSMVLIQAVAAYSAAADWDAATAAARAIPLPQNRAEALALIIERLGPAHVEQRLTLEGEVEALVRKELRGFGAESVIAVLARGALLRGEVERAVELALTVALRGIGAQVFSAIAATSAEMQRYDEALTLTRRLLQQAKTREEAFAYFPLVLPLLEPYPGIGQPLAESFAWVEEFLTRSLLA